MIIIAHEDYCGAGRVDSGPCYCGGIRLELNIGEAHSQGWFKALIRRLSRGKD